MEPGWRKLGCGQFRYDWLDMGVWQSAIYLVLIQFVFTSCFARQQDGLGLPKTGWTKGGDTVPRQAGAGPALASQ